MKDYRGEVIASAPPGTPIRILGFKLSPQVGDIVEVAADQKDLQKIKPVRAIEEKVATVEVAKSEEEKGERQFDNLLLKSDVLGSLEAILVSLEKFSHPEVGVEVVAKGLGNVTEADVLRAEASSSWIAAFNVLVPPAVAELAREKGVTIKIYKVIYNIFDDVRARLETMLSPEILRVDFGDLKVLAVFHGDKEGQVVGGAVTSGKAVREAQVKISRDGLEEGEGTVLELQSNKRSVPEVAMGSECGVKVKTRVGIKEGDLMHFYREEKKVRKLEI